MQKLILFVVLAVTAYKDIKERKVYTHVLLLAGMIGVLCCLWYQQPVLPDMFAGMAVGAGVLVLACFSRGNIGLGDGWMLMVSGIFLGFRENILLFFMALVLVGSAALFLIVVKRRGKKDRMPFLPFLFTAYLLLLL